MKIGHTQFSKELVAELKELTIEEAKEKYPHIREVYLVQLTKSDVEKTEKSKKSKK